MENNHLNFLQRYEKFVKVVVIILIIAVITLLFVPLDYTSNGFGIVDILGVIIVGCGLLLVGSIPVMLYYINLGGRK